MNSYQHCKTKHFKLQQLDAKHQHTTQTRQVRKHATAGSKDATILRLEMKVKKLEEAMSKSGSHLSGQKTTLACQRPKVRLRLLRIPHLSRVSQRFELWRNVSQGLSNRSPRNPNRKSLNGRSALEFAASPPVVSMKALSYVPPTVQCSLGMDSIK